MKQIILGTAGHVDHGKTTLIKAVTGVNTDRLKEEQLRGITIELGFASFDLPGGQRLGIVDVPGHEKFVKNMVAGATGIDIVAMVIAADEGVMPQTKEHMEICALLDVKYGLVVLTKTDLVDEEWLELVLDDIKGFTKGTFLENMPVVPVSSATGKGIDEFIKTLDELSAVIPERPLSSLFRLPVDRVFSMKGFGTVITGTLVSGRIQTGDNIMICPSGITSKVRGIQVHNQSVNFAEAGMRTAINFQGLEKAAINRGEVVTTPGALVPTYMADVSVHYLNSNKKSLKNRKLVRLHTGTSEALGNLILLDSEEMLPGETREAQLRLDSPVALVRDDRFVIRSYSPVYTIGGGYILNPIPKKHKRFKPEVIAGLKCLASDPPEKIIAYHAKESGYQGVLFSELKIMTNLNEKKLDLLIQNLLSKKILIQTDREHRSFIHQSSFSNLQEQVFVYLKNYHKANPLKAGMPKEELKSKFPHAVGTKLFSLVIDRMVEDGKIISDKDTVRLAAHNVFLKTDQADVRKKILDIYLNAGFQPPYFKEISKTLDMDFAKSKDVFLLLVKEGLLIKAKEDLYFHTDVINDLKKKLVDFLVSNNEITTPGFKEMTGASRKYVIPLIEYFDSQNVTIRIGDIRKLRKG